MDIKQLSPDFATTSQIEPQDVREVSSLGFRTILDNRPDGEAPDQPSSTQMEVAAHSAGLGFAYVPIVPGELSDHEALELRQILATMEKPVLAYCRSGSRSAALWQRYCDLPAEPVRLSGT